MIDIFSSIEGLTPVDPKDIEEFEKEMKEKVIPEIVKIIHQRNKLAVKSRHWIIGE